MNKVIIISEQPKGLAKILNGDKRIDIRKTMPKCELPIDVYLYCKKGTLYFNAYENEWQTGKVDRKLLNPNLHHRSGKVIAKFTLNKVEEVVDNRSSYRINNDEAHTNEVARKSCLDFKEMKKYLEGKNGYAWHIDDLEVVAEPKELSEFYKNNIPYVAEKEIKHAIEINDIKALNSYKINKAPQGWHYAWLQENK